MRKEEGSGARMQFLHTLMRAKEQAARAFRNLDSRTCIQLQPFSLSLSLVDQISRRPTARLSASQSDAVT